MKQQQQETLMRSTNSEFEWMDNAIRELRRLWSEGHSTPEIGRRIGVEKNAVVGKVPQASATARARSLDRNQLREAIAVRRQRLAEREAALAAACEKALGHGAGRHIRLDDRTTWGRAAWNRYVGTAARLESEFMPEMLRLIRYIERLERLAALPVGSQGSAT